MASSGPNNPGTTAGGSETAWPWSNTGNAASSDNNYATATTSVSSANTTCSLQVTNFGFAIPGGATIDGVVVEIERKSSGTSPNIYDRNVKLIKGGTIQGNNKGSASAWPTSDTYATYGSSSDKWGLTLTDSDINASNFGASLTVYQDDSGKIARTASVDHIRITVYYTTGAAFVARQQRPIQQSVKRSNFY